MITKEKTAELSQLIRSLSKGTIFSVVFTKRTTGEERKMLCRLGVRKGLKGDAGKGPAYDPLDKGLLCVWDMQKNGYRSIPLDAIKSITIKGQTYKG